MTLLIGFQVMGGLTGKEIDSPFNPARASSGSADEEKLASDERLLRVKFSVSDDDQAQQVGKKGWEGLCACGSYC